MIRKFKRIRETSKFLSPKFYTSSNSLTKRKTSRRKSTQTRTFIWENLMPPKFSKWWESSKFCPFLSNREWWPFTPSQVSWELERFYLLLPIAKYCLIGFSLIEQNSAHLWFLTTIWFQSIIRGPTGNSIKTMIREKKPTAVKSLTRVDFPLQMK